MEPTVQSSLRDRLAAALAASAKQRVQIGEQVPAAVVIPVFERDGEPWMVFTRRTQHVKHHKGEISFPGGARDPGDADIRATAIRETVEELGIDAAALDVVGELDDYPTFVTNYLITPFVALIPEEHSFRHSEREIDEVIELPVREMASAVRTEDWSDRGRPFPMYFYETRGYTVWGVTGHILQRFLAVAGEALGAGTRAGRSGAARTVVEELAAKHQGLFDWVGVYWVEDDEVVLGPYVGAYPHGHDRIKIPDGVCGAVAASGRTEVVPDVRARPGHIACELSTRSEVVAPIVAGREVIGVLDVDSNTLDAFNSALVGEIEGAAARVAGP